MSQSETTSKISDFIDEPPEQHRIFLPRANVTTSTKPWAAPYNPGLWTSQSTLLSDFENPVLGYGPLDSVDDIRLDEDFEMTEYERLVATEAEVQALFVNAIDHVVQAAWQPQRVFFRYEIGPPPVVLIPNASMTVDFMAQSYRQEDLGTPLVVGELKKPGIIRKDEWLNPGKATAATMRLAQEARA
jgi:hypothetical protein